MKNVLVLIHDDEGQEARLQAALDLARALEGHLICADVADLVIAGDRNPGDAIVVLDTRLDEAANRARIERRLAVEQVPWSWIDMAGDSPANSLLSAAGSADLIVVGGRDDAGADAQRHLVSRLLARTRALVVVVAEGQMGVDVNGSALLAWDGSEPCVSAMQRAVPLLALARSVRILEVGIPEEASSAEDAATYLSRHGIHAELLRVQQRDDFASTIAVEARLMKAAYCLMGGYEHSQLSEAIFGGVTRAMLTGSEVTLIMGH
jgi:nucleotide-binding universal stress UspA family protein